MDALKVNIEMANALQEHALLNKGLSLLTEVFNDYRNGNTKELDASEIDAIETFLTSTQRKYAEDLKKLTDELI